MNRIYKKLNYLANTTIYIILLTSIYQLYFYKMNIQYKNDTYFDVEYPIYIMMTIITISALIIPYSIKLIKENKIIKSVLILLSIIPINLLFNFFENQLMLPMGSIEYVSFLNSIASAVVVSVFLLLSSCYKVYYINKMRNFDKISTSKSL